MKESGARAHSPALARKDPCSRGENEPRAAAAEIALAGTALVADCAGALYWPGEKLLVVADLHLEKGSAFARRGVLLPPYDTATTLARLAERVTRYAPRAVVALGDSFHDGGGPCRMAAADRAVLRGLQRGRDWLWIAGNHDPDPPDDIGGRCAQTLACGGLTFRHQPSPAACAAEVAGHLHPLARVARRGRALSRRCFANDGERLVMPAFGAYAGGLNIRDFAVSRLFSAPAFAVHLLGDRRLYVLSAQQCLMDRKFDGAQV